MRLSTLILVAAMALVLAVLISLGTWQVQRLQWKEALIERVNARLANDPVTVTEALASAESAQVSPDYTPVTLEGTFVPDVAFFEFTTFEGRSGWNLFNLLELVKEAGDGASGFTLVNRGFIPFEARDRWQEIAALPSGSQRITGLLRIPPDAKPGSFMPDNKPQERLFYWRDISAMAGEAGISRDELASWYVDAGIPGKTPPVAGSYPLPGTTIISFSNNHLQYAVTWYGLALALLGVGSYFLYSRRKTPTSGETGRT